MQKKTDYLSYITDSNSLLNKKSADKTANTDKFKDADASCDVVFDSIDNFGNKVFYVVQSKWNAKSNCAGEIERTDVAKALNDFETILRGDIQKVNEKLLKKLEDLYEHLKNNGEVKFIFLSLCKNNPKTEENINSFLLSHPEKTKIEIIDLERLKLDYIDRKFKKIEPINPLENYYDPQEIKVPIEIERLGARNGNYIKVDKPFDAYVFLIRPKTIYELFRKYGFYLFYKNVRNPLLQSDFNKEIEKTAIENPAYFWYYNNGITGITYSPFPSARKEAQNLELNGLQIINGAQTVYSLFTAYKQASPTKKMQMDTEILITLRLLKSGGDIFDLNVTRFTNSQNPIQDRDFCANNPIQEKLQKDFYNTKFWYEKRRGEFRDEDKEIDEELKNRGIKIVPNVVFANAYLAYHLQDPISVFNNFQQMKKSKKDLIFLSHKENKDGLFEKIFNDDTRYEDMLCSFYVFDTIFKRIPLNYGDIASTNLYHVLSLFKIVFTKYIHKKINDSVSINRHIIQLYQADDKKIIIKTFKFINEFINQQIGDIDKVDKDILERHVKFLTAHGSYERIKEELENLDLDISKIENMPIKNDEAPEPITDGGDEKNK